VHYIKKINENEYIIVNDSVIISLAEEEFKIRTVGSERFNKSFFAFKSNQVCKIKKPVLQDNKLSFLGLTEGTASQAVNGSISSLNDGIKIKIDGYNVSILIPKLGSSFINHDMCPTDSNTHGWHKEEQVDPWIQNISHSPVVHQMAGKVCLGILSECDRLDTFMHDKNSYLNFSSKKNIICHIKQFQTKRQSIVDWMKKTHQISKRDDFIVCEDQIICLDQMKNILYCGYTKKISSIHYNRDIIKKIQHNMKRNNIEICLVGSFAMILHGMVPSDFKSTDIDIIVDDINKVKNIYPEGIEPSSASKWSGYSWTVKMDGYSFDFTEVVNFDWDHDSERVQQINVISKEKLLFMKLLGEYERQLLNPDYESFRIKNNYNIEIILKNIRPFMYPFLKDRLERDNSKRFMELWDKIEQMDVYEGFISVNDPLVFSAYIKKNKLAIPIINNGSRVDAKIKTDVKIVRATWIPLEGEKALCEYNGTEAKVNNIVDLGILELETNA